EDHPPPVRTVPGPLQGLRGRGRGPRDLRVEDEGGPAVPQGRVLLLEVGIHGSERRGRPPRRVDALPADGESTGHLSRCRARARPRAAIPRREGAVPGRLQLPRGADGNRGVPRVHRRGPSAWHDGPGAVPVPEGRVDGRGGPEEDGPERWSEGAAEAPWPTETLAPQND